MCLLGFGFILTDAKGALKFFFFLEKKGFCANETMMEMFSEMDVNGGEYCLPLKEV